MSYSNSKTKRSRPFEAKWPGTCKKCGEEWKKKTMLVYENGVLIHANCPSDNGSSGRLFKRMLATANSVASDNSIVEEGENILREIESKPFVPSSYQIAAFEWGANGTGNAVMEAVPGSGKTTTIIKMLDILPSYLRILFVAFNRDIVKDLRSRVPKHITVKTLNGLGFSVIRKLEDFQDVDPDKVSGIMNEFWSISKDDIEDPKLRSENRTRRSAMRKLVSLVKNTLTDFNDPGAVLGLINKYKIEIDEQMEQEIIEKLPYVMEQNNSNLEHVDLDDQIYLPLVNPRLKNHFDQYDFILGDECQDWNAANIQLVLKHLAPEGRLMAVGDRKQSINGFRGADTQAIPHIIEQAHAITLPLSICYRCPRSHIELVKHLIPQIEAAPNAKEGTVGYLKYEQMMEMVKEGDMVLCRTNAPLVRPAFACIKNGIKAIIKGKAIGEELVNYIERFQCDELGRLDVLMQEHTQYEIERYLRKNQEMMAEQVQERYTTILEVSRECKNVSELVIKLQDLFSDNNIGVVFSSVHRSKGLEAKTVFLYREDELMPHPKAKTEEELEQENNLIVVARTRSKDTLYFVKGEEYG